MVEKENCLIKNGESANAFAFPIGGSRAGTKMDRGQELPLLNFHCLV